MRIVPTSFMNSSEPSDEASDHIRDFIVDRVGRNMRQDREFHRVVEALRAETGRCILVLGPKERVNRGPGFVDKNSGQ